MPMMKDVPPHGISPAGGAQDGLAVQVGDVFTPGGQDTVGGESERECTSLPLFLKPVMMDLTMVVHFPFAEDDGKEEDGVVRLAGNITARYPAEHAEARLPDYRPPSYRHEYL